MSFIKNPELRGILALLLIIIVLAVVMMATTGKLEQWFGITLFSGPQAYDKIVFVSDGDIFTAKTDGSERERITRKAQVASIPGISSKANRIIYIGSAGSVAQIFTVGVKGGVPNQISTASGPKSWPAFSPDGKNASFIASGKVYVADIDGGNLDPVLPGHAETQAAMVARGALPSYSKYAWGPDSKSMAGVTRDDSDSDVFVYLPELEGEATKIPFAAMGARARITHISWASQQPILAITATSGKSSMVLVFNADEKKLQPLLRQDGLEFGAPAVSPDGSSMVIPTVKTGGKAKSMLMKFDLQANQAAPIAQGKFENPVFSPSGDKVLATRIDPATDKRDLVSIDLSSGEVTQITQDGDSYDGIWTPVEKK